MGVGDFKFFIIGDLKEDLHFLKSVISSVYIPVLEGIFKKMSNTNQTQSIFRSRLARKSNENQTQQQQIVSPQSSTSVNK